MAKPKWLQKTESKRKQSDKRVKKVAKATGGKPVANSGATYFSKGDISYEAALLEHKMTSKKSFKLSESDLAKHYRDSVKAGKRPLFMVEFDTHTIVGEIQKK